MGSATDSDRKNQLRRFLDVLSRTSATANERRQWRKEQTSAEDSDVTGEFTDDDDDGGEARPTSQGSTSASPIRMDDVEESTTSAMDQVRQLVNRRGLPVVVSSQPHSDWLSMQRVDDACSHLQHTTAPSVTSKYFEQAILGAAADLVSQTAAQSLIPHEH